MKGPMDRLFGHSAFDFNHDGKIDAAEWAFINDTIFKEEEADSSDDYDDADLDPDDFDDEF